VVVATLEASAEFMKECGATLDTGLAQAVRDAEVEGVQQAGSGLVGVL
jgi:hypothetical protein